jgi:hypothetical protein
LIRKHILPRADLLLLAVAAIPVIMPQPKFSPLLLAVPLGWLAARRWRGRALELTPLNAAVLLMALMMLVSLYATYSIEQSFPKIAGLIVSIGVFFTVVGNIRTRKSFYWSSSAFIFAGVGVAALGALGSRWLQKTPILIAITERLPSISFGLHGSAGGFHPNEIAGVLLWVAPLALAACALIIAQRAKLSEKIGGVWTTVLFIASVLAALATWGVLILTQSRSGWLGAAAVLLWAGAVLLNRRLPFTHNWRRLIWVAIALALIRRS